MTNTATAPSTASAHSTLVVACDHCEGEGRLRRTAADIVRGNSGPACRVCRGTGCRRARDIATNPQPPVHPALQHDHDGVYLDPDDVNPPHWQYRHED